MIKVRRFVLACVLGIILLLFSIMSFTYATNNVDSGIFPPDSKPYGLTYGEWSAEWWKWYSSIPQESNPGNDDTGKSCAMDQKDTHVWFLVGTGGGSADRTCTIPSGKAILFPIINTECSYATDPLSKTESEMRSCAMSVGEGASVQATVDRKQLQNLDKYRVQSPLFNTTLPTNNIFGAKPGFTPMFSDGWWILLAPLPPGTHEIYFSGVVPDNPTTGTKGFATEATYHLTVEP